MVRRVTLWLGAGAITAGVLATLTAGAAAADPGQQNGAAGTSSESTSQSTSPSAHQRDDRHRPPTTATTSSESSSDSTESARQPAGTRRPPSAAGRSGGVPQRQAERTITDEADAAEPAMGDNTASRPSRPSRTTTLRPAEADHAAAAVAKVTQPATTEVKTSMSAVADRPPVPVVQPASVDHQPVVITATQTGDRSPSLAATATAAPATAPAVPRAPPSPIAVISTLIYNVFASVQQAFTPPPVIPAGSSVTYGRSTLELPGSGQTVSATWYFPNQEAPPQGVIYLQHGFFRSAGNVSPLAIQLAQQTNSVVVTPTITSNPLGGDGYWINGAPMQQAVAELFVGDRSELTASAQAAGWSGELPQTFVLAGHSAGGGLAVAAAADYITTTGSVGDLAGVLMVDGVSLSNQLSPSLATLDNSGLPVLQIASPPSPWNSFGSGSAQLVAARPGQFVGVEVVGGTHIDAEGTLADLMTQLMVGFPSAANVAAVQTLASTWINDMYSGTPVAGAPAGQLVTIPTQYGNATAVVLPTPSTPLTPVIGALRDFTVLVQAVLWGSALLGAQPAVV